MSYFPLLVASAASCVLYVAPASAQAAAELHAFAQQPLSERDLADSYGGGVSSIGEVRALVDPDALGFLQQAGRASNIAMDNWWSQTGAALIAENLLARAGN